MEYPSPYSTARGALSAALGWALSGISTIRKKMEEARNTSSALEGDPPWSRRKEFDIRMPMNPGHKSKRPYC
jgi:hypothetical protein